jgi:chromosomal replication initiation ATPase DnaA
MLTAQKIVDQVLAHTDVQPGQLFGRGSGSKAAEVCTARAVAMTIVRDELGYSSERIGRIFKRDHSSVWHAIRRCRSHPPMQALYEEIVSSRAGSR